MHTYVSNIPPLRHCFLVIYHSTTKQGVEICTTKLEGSDLMLVRGRTRFPGRLSLLHTWRAQDTSKADNFMLEFSHDQLYDFFQKIERVQQQLDSLS